uniref:FBD domain-containing protein n=1 Tax=Leersia perrieri TaxID=77586 RepID=A0A0D9VGQ1_9ORYZ
MYLTIDSGEAQQSDAIAGDKKNYLKQAFVSLTNIQELTINGAFLTYLSRGYLLTELPGVFDHLRKICIGGCSLDWTKVLGVCSIFQNAPTFSELEIRVACLVPSTFICHCFPSLDYSAFNFILRGYVVSDKLLQHLQNFSRPEDVLHQPIWDQDQMEIEEPTMHHLVTIKDFLGLEYEVALVGLLLRWCEDEDWHNDECMCKALTRLLALHRVSNKAKIIIISDSQ